ncbi:hypothetical protein DFH06DRAFT_1193969 [Mycena polygramma]|nr:hypothetical protein DFH06DRAFT_1193969 [Mycena polygramma]
MNSLPPELHSLIVELACVSPFGGHTTRAMALTCTYFHEISAPFLLYTVAVSSQDQANKILEFLEAPPTPKHPIHRLFIGPALSLAPASALRLLHFAAPTVRDLAVILPSSACSSSLLGAVFRTRLPRLRTLAVRGFYPLPRPGAFPALTHLYLSGNYNPAGVPASLARACPLLTHLRVSSLRGAPAFARELRDALAIGADVDGPDTGCFFPPNIESVVLEAQKPVPHAKSNSNKVAELRDVQMRAVLVMLTEEAGKRDSGRPCVQFSEADEGDAERMKDAWLGVSVC